MILSKKKKTTGSHLEPKSQWLVAMMMAGDQVIALDPWTKRERKVKQFRVVELPYGVVWQQFCNVAYAGFFRLSMRLPQGFDESASIVLPMPHSIASDKLCLKSPSMEQVKDKMAKILDAGELLEQTDDELETNKVTDITTL